VSRFYDALMQAERDRTIAAAPTRPATRGSRDHVWDWDAAVRAEYDGIQEWLARSVPADQPAHTLMVASCGSGNGATTTAARLAVTLAQRHHSAVLLVDANLRTPGLDQVFNLHNRGGFSELVSNGHRDSTHYIQTTWCANLWLLTAGRTPRAPGEMVAPVGLARLLEELKARFEFIVFDAPPLLDFPDGYSLAAHVDVVLMVVEAGKTQVEDARRVTRQLRQAGVRASGVVFNRHRDHVPRVLRRALSAPAGSGP
jgi:protein-tyrosine kinase